MKRRTKISLASVGLAGAGVGLAFLSGHSKWNCETVRLVTNLKKLNAPSRTKTVSFEDFENLPAPVARYFRFALKENQPVVRTARIRHAGEFNLNDKWIPFESVQDFSANPPAFVWDAQMRTNRLMRVRVRDGYAGGKGTMQAKIFSVFTVMNAAGDNEKLASGALLRFLAESAWQPTALLPGENLKWTAIDESRALATLTDAGVTVSLQFTFNETGEIVGVFSPARYKEINGEYESFPWAGRFWNYAECGGMMIPLEGEVEWRMPEGNAPYWRGRVTEAKYEFEK